MGVISKGVMWKAVGDRCRLWRVEDRCGKGGCEEDGLGLVQVEERDSTQSEMNLQCEQFISTFDPPLHILPQTYMHAKSCDQLLVVAECR